MGQRAALYCRVSTTDQSCARQERDLIAFAKRAGYEVVGDGTRMGREDGDRSPAHRNNVMAERAFRKEDLLVREPLLLHPSAPSWVGLSLEVALTKHLAALALTLGMLFTAVPVRAEPSAPAVRPADGLVQVIHYYGRHRFYGCPHRYYGRASMGARATTVDCGSTAQDTATMAGGATSANHPSSWGQALNGSRRPNLNWPVRRLRVAGEADRMGHDGWSASPRPRSVRPSSARRRDGVGGLRRA